jgi:hypothetical protein
MEEFRMKERRRRMNKRQEKERKLWRIWRLRKFEIFLFWLDIIVHGTALCLALTSAPYPKAWVWRCVGWQHKSWRQENLIWGFILIKSPDLRNAISDQISGRWKSFRSLQPMTSGSQEELAVPSQEQACLTTEGLQILKNSQLVHLVDALYPDL